MPVNNNFSPQLITTAIQKPDFEYRGLYPWNYNWNLRGMQTFCDIEYHFVNKDWDWYYKLCDWMVKNKQNAVFWFDDVWTWNNLSGQFPQSVNDYYALWGVKKMLGLGWASNSGRPRGRGWEEAILVDTSGKAVDKYGWQSSVSPKSALYYPLAQKNIDLLNTSGTGNYLGTIIGYGENTWASNEGAAFIKLTGIKPSDVMINDLRFVGDKLRQKGLGALPLGFKVSSYSQRNESPFNTDNFFKRLPKNTVFSMHTYRFDTWKLFDSLYKKIDSANKYAGYNMKVLHIGEVAFLCNADIPLLRTSTLRTREAHLRTLPRQSTFCHLTTLNTTQYLYWLMSYQMMRWQWQMNDDSWFAAISGLFTGMYGKENGDKLGGLFEKMNALEYVRPSDSSKNYLRKSVFNDLEEPAEWTRYKNNATEPNTATHTDDYGFKLWAGVGDFSKLKDGGQTIEHCLSVNEELYKNLDSLYKREFYPTIALTLHYYGIRVQTGLYQYYLAEAKRRYQTGGWTVDVEKGLLLAKAAVEAGAAALSRYNAYLAGLLRLPGMEYLSENNIAYTYVRESIKKDLGNDFVFNPSNEYFSAALSNLEKQLQQKGMDK